MQRTAPTRSLSRAFFTLLLGAMSRIAALLLVFCAISLLGPPRASAITIDTVPVGNLGNANDPATGGLYGGVSYNYRIGTTEVTNAQYVEFLNAVAATDTYGLYNTMMSSDTWGGITRSGSSGSYLYSVKAAHGAYSYATKPVNYVSWGDATRFANWLHNGQPAGLQSASTTEDGAYTLSGAVTNAALNAVSRNSGATWFLTSEDEWYKAAYYDGNSATYSDYATGTDTTPDNNLPSSDSGNSANFYDNGFTTGDINYPLTDAGAYKLSGSPYGTFDQGGNVHEWNEALMPGSFRGLRGGSFANHFTPPFDILIASYRAGNDPSVETGYSGFRVATIPEPGSGVLAVIACGLMWLLRKRFK